MTDALLKFSDHKNDLDYDPDAHAVGIVHIGIGAFHRAHQAVYTDDVLAKFGGDWRILGVSLRSAETANALNEQNGHYHLVIRPNDTEEPQFRVIRSVAGVLAAANGIDPIVEAMAQPNVRIVSLTITEKAYCLERATGKLDVSDPAIAHDLKNPDAPRSAVGLIVRALQIRQARGLDPFTAMSCDNLPDNGLLLKKAVLSFAQCVDTKLANWIEETTRFPSTMVDRITPATTDALISEVQTSTGISDRAPIETEAFSQWVIEDSFSSGRPAWDSVGVMFTRDIRPYEEMKLRMLNGAHSLMAYTGFLSRCRYVRDAMSDTRIAALIEMHIRAASRTLAQIDGVDYEQYGRALINRFKNPNIAHETYQIAMDGSQKMPQRIFEPALHALEHDGDIRTFAFATAIWIKYLIGRHDDGDSYALRDPREAEFAALCTLHSDNAEGLVKAIFDLPDLVPAQLAQSLRFQEMVQSKLVKIMRQGITETIEDMVGDKNG
ncbi:mannitol dehydrogenase family protein [Cognatishimia maritima]|uniref:Fructuronate reductase n=1 Tax=Cognatishimia maritima TaxID=870908 RepID=A0A1M5QUU9_9RHOB|nr:mannitol dehydrogenase family protein [Cognatishimia maritima]SHH17937.1 fructuronate reductase [Cognatishimia maritima]